VESLHTARPRGRVGRKAALAAAATAGALALSGCSVREVAFLNLPEPGTDSAALIDSLWQGAWVAAWAVGFLTWGLMIWAWVAYRRRKADDPMPVQTRYNIPIEVLYTVTPLIMIFGLFAFALRDQTEIARLSDDYDHEVQAVGFRWSWTFNYLDEEVYDIGTPQEFPTLWLPVDEKVRIKLNSPDVVHSFWVPTWLYKLDVIPGQTNEFEVTPTQTGEFAGKCAELCGTDHSRMLFNVKVVSRAEFDQHVEDLKAAGQTGALQTPLVNSEGDVRRNQ
jgi:cytochrome c oxidase subunit 2